MKQYDSIIIGSGAGLKLKPLSLYGKSVAIIEKDHFGGTCLQRGCIPSKMLLYPSELVYESWKSEKFGLKGRIEPDHLEVLFSRIRSYVSENGDRIASSLHTSNGVDVYAGEARFVGDKCIEVSGERIQAKTIYIASGARPFIPDIPGLASVPYWTSTQALFPEKLPKNMAIIGGGYIACEIASFYAAMGVSVTMYVRSNRILKDMDSVILSSFLEAFSHHVSIRYATLPSQVYQTDEGVACVVGEEHVVYDTLLVASGVCPNTDMLNLSAAGVKTDERGYIMVDEYLQTSATGVYAFGDVIGRYMFRHSANFEGEYLLNNALSAEKQPISYPPMPYAMFAHPEIAGVGMTYDTIASHPSPVVVGEALFEKCAKGEAMQARGKVRIYIEKTTRLILGAHIVGPRASELLHIILPYMTENIPLDRMLSMIYIHPALPEVVKNAVKSGVQQCYQ